ncbi:nucleotide-binding protein [Corallococcus sp. AS-1-12]|uniref:nucleotide-binding protein n=1 Tax=Corallococcus sp. AS-1-12 TaxID=2874598 RepID=UPI001CBC3E1F|nr:nucleotide-binding protein [Corallococcus sp. AS-1-12]MBZ4336647.1 nucleotide-binding protein [Corallococcus sp. AS-1-12]
MVEADGDSRPLIVFWSWQSDSDASVNRNFIEDCLERAVKKISKSRGLLITVDRDTKDVGGTPSIAETILRKIRSSDLFVFDATHVYRRPRAAPNPNVALELGYALAVLGETRVIGVRNTVGTKVDEEPPFDFRHRKWPIDYVLRPSPGWLRKLGRRFPFLSKPFQERRAVAREALVKTFEQALIGALGEPKTGALRADVDLKAAIRLWALVSSSWLQGWVKYRLNYPQYEDRDVLGRFNEYVRNSSLPENRFSDERIGELHEAVIGSMRGYLRVSAFERIPDEVDGGRFVISAKANAHRAGRDYRENDAIYERQVAAIEGCVQAIWDAWERYVREMHSRYPEVVEAGVKE